MAVLGMGVGADGMIPGPPSRENGGSLDCSSKGLVAYGAGSSIVISDIRSTQLVTALPMPPTSTTPLHPAPFVTSVRWIPEPMQRDILTQELSTLHLLLAVGDRQGRIAIWDTGSRNVINWLNFESEKGKLGIQDLCWLHSNRWLLVAIHGASLLAIWNTKTGRCIWKYDASPEILACICRDPFDYRHVCVLGLKGLVCSVKVTGDGENDIILEQRQLQVSETVVKEGNLKADKEGGGGSHSSSSPAFALFPNVFVKCMFSSRWAHIIYVMFPREMIVFDLHYEVPLSVTALPRGFGKFFDLVAEGNGDLLYCAHVDGKLSAWKRKEGKQVYMLCMMEALMPSVGTPVPSPAVLAVSHCPSEFKLEKVSRTFSEELSDVKHFQLHTYTESTDPSMLSNQAALVLETPFISISDDGKMWNWSLTAEVQGDSNSTGMNQAVHGDFSEENGIASLSALSDTGVDSHAEEENKTSLQLKVSSSPLPKTSVLGWDEPIFKLNLIGQMHLISSTVTTLAVPAPSLTATLTGGGNDPAVAVPLVALATQGGCIEVVDVAANAVATSFSVHNSSVRGLRWLGNSRLVSFSYTQVNEKGGGYINRLAVTCVRSGLSRFFRVLQKPERAPMRALRASPSGRYLLILFREAPVEVWAMTRNPQMLRSLALPFTVMEWALPPVPKPPKKGSSRQSLFAKERPTIASTVAAASANSSSADSRSATMEGSADETAESFAFALVNGSLGVFELRGRRVRDFRPKWPSTSFVSSDVLVTAMAYRMPHVVMGDRSGNIRWWDVTSGLSSSFNSHRGGIRRIKFAPVVFGDQSRGRVAVLFNDNTFSIFDLDTQDPLANAILQPQFAGILVLELDWFPLRFDKKEPLLLCIAGADSSFRLLEVNTQGSRSVHGYEVKTIKERFRPMPLCSPALLPPPHALALRMLLQWGVQPSWFDTHKPSTDAEHLAHTSEIHLTANQGDLRHYMLDTSLRVIGDSVVPELLLKILEPYRKAGRLLDNDRARMYAALLDKGCTARFAFAAAHFGEFSEGLFWLQLPHALSLLTEHVNDKSLKNTLFTNSMKSSSGPSTPKALHMRKSVKKVASFRGTQNEKSSLLASGSQDYYSCNSLRLPCQGLDVMPSEQGALLASAMERISWHEKLGGEDATQKRVHELVSVGNLEAAVTLLLSTPPESPYFYVDALRAVALSSAVSSALHELAVKVVAANMVGTDKSLSGTHLLCAVGRYQEACSQLQDAGCWTDAATLAASHLQGSDYSRVLQRWADHVLYNEHNMWRALILYVEAGALHEALAVLRDAQQPDTAAMFLLACHEAKAKVLSQGSGPECVPAAKLNGQGGGGVVSLDLPSDLNQQQEDVLAVCEYYGHYQRTLVHLCTGMTPVLD
eukprot:Gb_06602 [translate_table: standard]